MKNAQRDFVPLAHFLMIASVNHEIVIEDNVIGAVDNNLDNASNLHYNPK